MKKRPLQSSSGHRQAPNPPVAPGDSVHPLPVAHDDHADEKDVVTDQAAGTAGSIGQFISQKRKT